MELETIRYSEYEKDLPQKGNYIIGTSGDSFIIVYQAFNDRIADFAIKNQRFGGEFNLNRMSWIKPGFLWMMYRSDWARKEAQERILAIKLEKTVFNSILNEAVHSSFREDLYQNIENWKGKLSSSNVRVQWDPDHDPFGKKLERKAIQLGLKGIFLKKYSGEWILSIEDITSFVSKQRELLKSDFKKLEVIRERVIHFEVSI
jgi:hypothetical protein